MLVQNDFVNANTGKFDPRAVIGMTSQDVFRWPAIKNGTQRQLLGQFITTLEIPGTPALYWGEEQSLYLLDSTSSDFLYGRQPMSSSPGWQLHGCYHVGDDTYYGDFPDGPATTGCHDDAVSLDHKDPSHPTRNVIKRMYELRRQYPVLNDGYMLKTLSNQTNDVYLPGSANVPSTFGVWSVWRYQLEGAQDLETPDADGNQGVWLVYSNLNRSEEFTFDCQDEADALVSPFAVGTTVKNLFYPHDEHVLQNSSAIVDGVTGLRGCLSNLSMESWGYRAYVPKASFKDPAPTITRIVPSHDERLTATVELGEKQTVPIEVHFSQVMDCDSVIGALSVNSTSSDGTEARISNDTIACVSLDAAEGAQYVGQPAGLWKITADLEDVSHGIHSLTIANASTADGTYTNAIDRFMFRIGASDNPVVFPQTGNYSRNLLHRNESTNKLYVSQRAAGADKFRYSTTWGSSWSNWLDYTSDNVTLEDQAWSGTSRQAWDGEHVVVQYWSRLASSSDHVQHGDLVQGDQASHKPRRWPHAFILGSWNEWGYDDGLANNMRLTHPTIDDGNSTGSNWAFDLEAEWPTQIQVNVWGMNPNGLPDKTAQFGDVDGDNVLDWLKPDTLADNVINITKGPGMPYVGWRLLVNDGTWNYRVVPTGSGWYQLALSILIGVVPLLCACLAVWTFKQSYYQVKFNQIGVNTSAGFWKDTASKLKRSDHREMVQKEKSTAPVPAAPASTAATTTALAEASQAPRRTTLIATMEYEIEDWNIKIKIGGLGKMASLMGSSALAHQNLIWVVPCVGGIEYPVDTVGEPMVVTINKARYIVKVQYHQVRNITFVLLDAPVFRAQTKADPYPARMDDIESAIYYSAWNACIAETLRRFPVDLYHINDYHGTLAPLYLLPKTVPVSLSLHNAEFQGMWSLRTKGEMDEITEVFNLPKDTVKTYVQFDKVFNMLYAAASYIRQFQGGFGAVGVSKKYGARAYKRYPIFWGLHEIGSLPNPDPDDMADWNAGMAKEIGTMDVAVDEEAEEKRGELRVQAQKWAGLEENPNVSNNCTLVAMKLMLTHRVGPALRLRRPVVFAEGHRSHRGCLPCHPRQAQRRAAHLSRPHDRQSRQIRCTEIAKDDGAVPWPGLLQA